MKNKILSLILGIIIILSNLTFTNAAQSCKPEADDYTIKNNVNMDISRIEIGETATISVDIIDNLVKTSEIVSADNISVTSGDGSFGKIESNSITITSSESENLKYTIKFKEATYTGSGSTITFKVKYKNLNLTSDKITVEINECSARDNDIDNSGDTTDQNVITKQPYVEISRSAIPNPIKANEEFTIKLSIKNRGGVEMKRPVMTLSLPDSINSLDGMGNIQIPDIDAGTSRNITLRFKGADYIQSDSEAIDITLSYNYNSGSSGLTQGIYTDRIFIPMESTTKSSAPLIQISRGSFSSPIESDTEFELSVKVKNIGETAITAPMLTFTFPEELIPLDDSSSFELPSLQAGEEVNKTLKLKTKKYISSSSQEITAELKYSYKSENDNVQGSETAKLIVPTKSNDDEGAEPLLQITSENIDKPLKSNENFSVKVTINNIGSTDLKAGVLNWESGDGIILTDKSSSVNIGSIKAGKSKEITLKGKTIDKLASTSQTITGELTYKYETGKGSAQGSETTKVVLPTQSSDETASNNATPNIIVNKYSYGGVPIANGSMFNFDVSFRNTSKTTTIDNIVMSLETGEGLSIHQASNTYYYENLSPQSTRSQSIGMQVLPTAETGSVKLTINFSYEYVENSERKQVTSSQNVSIPVYKPDKLEITLEPLAQATVGQEQTITLNYVNKGKGELSNVKAELTGDVTALTSVQNLGNFESGKSGTINFVVIPETSGEVNFTIKVSYEDANLEQKTLEFPCTMSVEEYIDESGMFEPEMPAEEETSSHKGIIIGLISGAVILIIIAIIIIKKRRKKKAAETVKVNWGAEDENNGLD